MTQQLTLSKAIAEAMTRLVTGHGSVDEARDLFHSLSKQQVFDAALILAIPRAVSVPKPDPWPTENLIAAEGRLWHRAENETYMPTGRWVGDRFESDGHRFTGPAVPVTVVHAAAWKELRAERELGGCDPVSLMVLTENVIAATDALGLGA